jgi:Antitoxin FitA-like, ribbon-helix-helix
MSRVIQIRDVPDDVHAALREKARMRGLSLSRYVRGELERLALETTPAQEDASVVRTRVKIASVVDRETILAALRERHTE